MLLGVKCGSKESLDSALFCSQKVVQFYVCLCGPKFFMFSLQLFDSSSAREDGHEVCEPKAQTHRSSFCKV